jgi:hypothetical protein
VAEFLRAVDVSGEAYDDPSEDLLFMLFEDLDDPGDDFTVEKVEAGQPHELVRVQLNERRSYEINGPGPDEKTASPFMRNVHEALTRWAFDLPDWREPLGWTTEPE